MKTNKTVQLSDTYFELLKTLSKEVKTDLIARLNDSMQNESNEQFSFKSLFGAFQSKKTAEEIIEEIRLSRTFKRQVENF